MKETIRKIKSFDGIKLEGSLYTRSSRFEKIVICVHGSLLQDRNGDLDYTQKWMFPTSGPKRSLFKDIREYLCNEDIAVFCYDKRASGNSEGQFSKTDLVTLAKDLIKISNDLNKFYPKKQQIFIGQSEGTLTIPIAIKLGLAPNMIILQGPVLNTFRETFMSQKESVALPFLNDHNDELFKKYPFFTAYYNSLFKGDLFEAIESSNEPEYTLKYKDYSTSMNIDLDRQWHLADIKNLIGASSIPIYYLLGEEDKNVLQEGFYKLQTYVKELGIKKIYFKTFKGLEHSFKSSRSSQNMIDNMQEQTSQEYLSYLKEIIEKY